MNEDHRLLKKLTLARRGKTNLYPLLGSSIVLAFFWIALRMRDPDASRFTSVALAILGLLVAIFVYRLILRKTQKTLHKTAADIDRAMASHNQLEALVELKDGDHPLRTPQEERIEQELVQYTPASSMRWLTLATVLICIELGGFAQQLFHPLRVSDASVEELVLPEEKKNEFAELKLTNPESEIRLKPMDEVAWKGTGRSSNGFDDFSLSVYLNGEPVADMPVDDAPLGTSGKVALTGEFFLDELNATPFDVISYHLTAHSRVNGKRFKEIISIPQFIEVRPFREDAILLDPADPEDAEDPAAAEERQAKIKILDFIHTVLEFEITLNKAVYIARASGLDDDDPVLQEQIGLLQQEQKQLMDTLDEFLDETDPRLLTPNMVNSLRTAEGFMDTAAIMLSTIAPVEERTHTL